MIADSDSFHCRVVLIGDASVGKTCILSQLVDHKFDPNEQSTVGANYQIFIEDFDGQKVEIQIWDTAGQEKFKSLGPIYFRNATGALVVFDQTNRLSFDHLTDWVTSFTDVAGLETTIFIVANKSDMISEIQVPFSEALQYAKEHNCQAFETSAMTGKGIPEMFTELARTVLKKRQTRATTSAKIVPNNDGGCGC
ncbi:small GTP-binding protein [Tritrichomonas foetus]|uniref:Small GTP-binding protein n=1 Tax=Tritrichomonas foetus TaxID=1144522 RepID=A0A1J4KGF0_9EUKA|nr:small GTP-binding protein [Tritrichomonas foetus]|eukprot:OHT10008.1 small GTP-binding protein [Tritrichomonas foetus]